jgi:hypothetical protein
VNSQVLIPVGGKQNEVAMYWDASGIEYGISSNGDIYILDHVNNKIKVFSKTGEYKLKISNFAYKIQRINIFSDLLILVTDNKIFVLNLAGEIVKEFSLNIGNIGAFNTIRFYNDIIFIPQTAIDFFSENMYMYRITNTNILNIKQDSLNLECLGFVKNFYKADRKYNELPVEKEFRPYLYNLRENEITCMSSDYIIFHRYYGPIKSGMKPSTYYLFVKRTKEFKKIGIHPLEKKNIMPISGRGRGEKIIDNTWYVLGGILDKQKPVKYPIENKAIIIKKIDLTEYEKLPSVKVDWSR